jgi:PKD repeat protein
MSKKLRLSQRLIQKTPLRTLLIGVVCGVFALLTVAGLAATTPSSGTLSPSNPTITFSGGPFAVSNPSSPVGATPPVCADATCGAFALHVAIPAGDTNTYNVTVSVSWTNSGTTTQGSTTSDYDLYIYQPSAPAGTKVGQGAGSTNPEVGSFRAATGDYTVYVVPYDVAPSVTFNATVTLTQVPPPPPPQPPPPPAPSVPGMPRYTPYLSPPGYGDDFGEPSIGVNWRTGKVMMYGGFGTSALRATFDDCSSPAKVTWENTPLTLAALPRVLGDPILFTDRETGRTFVSQLLGGTKQSTMDYTDDDGASYQPSQGSGINSGVDHQTVGGGRFAAGLSGVGYPNAVYYAAQDDADANCALSLDGGRTFGPAVPMYNITDCSAIHGHLKVSPADGTVYVPNKGCNGKQAVAVSTDNGITWAVRPVPTSSSGQTDPSVGVATDGTLFLGYDAGDGHARIAVSSDKGVTWERDTDVGAQLGIQNCVFPAVVAGDGGHDTARAAFAFFGTTTAGDYNSTTFDGIWYLYIASTFDGGRTWTTVNATPNDPIQRGGICTAGTLGCNVSRNLLDFFDATIDREGRVLVGYEDGCVGDCVQSPPNSDTAKAGIARQSGGKRMFAAYDPVEPTVPGAPLVTATKDSSSVAHLSWQRPDDGGSAITAYKAYRRTDTGSYALLATVTETQFDDTTAAANTTYFYRVTAVNSVGEGQFCGEVTPVAPPPLPNPCAKPGVRVLSDINSDGSDNDAAPNAPADGRANIRQLYVAEPFLGAGVNKLVFTLNVAPSTQGSAPPSSQWFIIWNRQHPDADFDRYYVAMKTDVTGAISYEYGKFGVPLPLDGSVPNPNANTPVRIGAADAGSYDVANGVIEITVATSKLENIQPGQRLAALNARSFLLAPDAGPKGQAAASDITDNGEYRLYGNAFCQVNNPPTAAMTASPLRGTAPLTVNFDASASSDRDGDAISLYTFNFGDGSPDVKQSSPRVSHTYSSPGNYFATLAVTDSHNAQSNNEASVAIEVQGVTNECLEDNDSRIAYSDGWHLVNSSNASGGHFRLHLGRSPNHSASLTFNVPAGRTGKISYYYATSTKGGTVDVYLDGVLKGTVNCRGSQGDTRSPVFGARVEYANIPAGQHTLTLSNMSDAVYIDKLCLESSSSNANPATGPGTTSSNSGSIGGGSQSTTNLLVPSGATGISVAAESSLPIRLVLINPSGLTLQTVDNSSGYAVINYATQQSGTYLIKVINLNLGPVQVWTVATPTVRR